MKASVWIFVLFFLILLSIAAVSLTDFSFIEQFNTTQYQDPLNTTAAWDTVAGNIRLGEPHIPIIGFLSGVSGYGHAIDGNHCFVAAGGSGLQVVDISYPALPVLVGTYDTPGTAMNIAVSGGELFIADGDSGLTVINIQDPTAPTLLGRAVLPAGQALDVAVSGDIALIAQESEGLYVVDVTDAANPVLVGSYDTPGMANAVAVDGEHVFVSDGATGIQAIDISDLTSPAHLGNVSLPGGGALDVAVFGNHLFAAGGAGGLYVIDITDPTAPVVEGNQSLSGDVTGISIDGTYVYATVTGYGLYEFDIRDPGEPVLLRTLEEPALADACGIRIAGKHAFILDMSSGLQVARIANTILSHVWPGVSELPSSKYYAVAGDIMYSVSFSQGIITTDISDPLNPIEIANTVFPGITGSSIATAGDYLYAVNSRHFIVFDVANPASPYIVTDLYLAGEQKYLAVSGHYAYASNRNLCVISIADPSNPVIVSTLDYPEPPTNNPYRIKIAGNYLYLSDWSVGFHIIDITDPLHPFIAGSTYYVPPYAVTGLDIAISGNFAYLAGGNGLRIYDVSDPANPIHVSNLALSTASRSKFVLISGNLAVVIGYDLLPQTLDWISLIDIRDPHNPLLLQKELNSDLYTLYEASLIGDFIFAYKPFNLMAFRVFERRLEIAATAQSLTLNPVVTTILSARLFSNQSGSISWGVSADGGSSWQEVPSDYTWSDLLNPGDDLRWRAVLGDPGPDSSTVCDSLAIEWSDELKVNFPDIVVSDTLIDFGGVFIGASAGSSFRIENVGDNQLLIHDIVWSNGDISADPVTLTVSQGRSRSVFVTFTPTVVGAFTDTLRIISNDPDEGEVTIPVAGEGLIPPEVEVSTELIVDSLFSGETSTQPLTVKNTGGSPLTFFAGVRQRFIASNMMPPIDWLSVSPQTGSVDAGDSLNLILTFDAGGLNGGTYLGEIVMQTNDLDETYIFIPVDLHVTGVPAIAVSDTLLDFERTYVGYEATINLMVQNNGTDVLNVFDISADHSAFSITPTTLDLGVGEWSLVSISCAPTQTEMIAATLTLTSNDTIQPSFEIGLIADAMEPPVVSVSTDSLVVSLFEGETHLDTMSLSNDGLSDLDWGCEVTSAPGNLPISKKKAEGQSKSKDNEQSPMLALQVLWHGDHGTGGIQFWSTIISDISNRAVVTESSAPITPALLEVVDILWLGERSVAFLSSEIDAIHDWISSGGSLLIEASEVQSGTVYTGLLQGIGSGMYYHEITGLEGTTPHIYPHETTGNVDAIHISSYARLEIFHPSAFPLVDDLVLRTACAAEVLEEGRIVVLADHTFHDSVIDVADNRLFANQVFNWFGAINWLTVTPSSGIVGAGQAVDLEVDIDATILPEGVYQLYMNFRSNDPAEPLVTIPVLLTVQTIVPTTLRNFSTTTDESGIEITWELSESSPQTRFIVLRTDEKTSDFIELEDAEIRGSNDSFYFVDKDYLPGMTYRYRVDVSDESDRRILFETEAITAPLILLRLHQNYPNPFSEQTMLSFTVPENMNVNLSIYDLQGRLVRTLAHDRLDIGYKEYTWDGKDMKGVTVGSGVYFYRLKAGGRELSKKMLLLK